MKKFIIVCILSSSFVNMSFASMSFVSYDIGLMSKYYDLTKGAYNKLFDIWYISKEDKDAWVEEAHYNIYNLGNNPEKIYKLAIEYFDKQQTIHNQTSIEANSNYERIKVIYDKLLALWYITSEVRESLGINAYKNIYSESGVAQNDWSKEYNIALDYEKKQWEIQNNKLNKDYYYGFTKDIYYRIFSNWLITQSEFDRQTSTAWDSIYNASSDPEKIYNSALAYEKDIQSKLTANRDKYYALIKEIYYKLFIRWFITQTDYENQRSTAWNDIYTVGGSVPEKIYNTALEYERNILKNYNANTSANNYVYASSLPQDTQDLITRKINNLDLSKREQWTSNVIDKIDVLLAKKSWSKKNRNILLAIQQFLQDCLEQNSSELNIDSVLN